MISLTVKTRNFNINKSVKRLSNYSIKLHDSFLLLPSPLRSLSDDLSTSTKKGFFPYRFVNRSNLNYVGPFPDISFFDAPLPPSSFFR